MKNNCPLCKNSNTKIISIQRNIPFTNLKDVMTKFSLSYCNNCSFVFQNSAYTKKYDKKIEKVYKNYFINHTFKFPRQDTTNIEALNFILPFIKDKDSVLEIGSSRGDFLYLLKEKIPTINILGIEPTIGKTHVPTVNSIFKENFLSNKFNIIILRHTLEHIKYPNKFIKKLKSISYKDTIIYIEVPNIQNNLEFRTEDFEPDHVSYFSLYTLNQLFKKYKIINYDSTTFLRVAFKIGKDCEPISFVDTKVNKQIKNIFKNKTKFMNKIKNEKRVIIFYGVSGYYYTLVYQIRKIRSLVNCYFYDDNYTSSQEVVLKLNRNSNFTDAVIIICSNVPYVQDKIEQKLKSYKCIIIKPWSKV